MEGKREAEGDGAQMPQRSAARHEAAGKPYHSLDEEWKRRFGGKVWKLSLQSGCSCPNRDGTIGYGGCIFCSEGGSGDFAAPACLPVREQIAAAKRQVAGKLPKRGRFAGYMAYFQSFTNTYGPVERLRACFSEALSEKEVLGLSIGTRPDCLPDEMIGMLSELNRGKPVTVELGLQTIHEKSAAFLRRGYSLPVFEDAVRRLSEAGLSVVVHLILGLPGETRGMMEESVRYLAGGGSGTSPIPKIDGIKLQLLHILRGTELGRMYETDSLPPGYFWNEWTAEEYAELVIDLLELLPPEMTVHRLTGDAPKRLLLAPSWSADKKRVLNLLTRRLLERESRQGKRLETEKKS